MKEEKLVPKIDICQLLKDAGFHQDTVYVWLYVKKKVIWDGKNKKWFTRKEEWKLVPKIVASKESKVVAAPTSSEIGEQLPAGFRSGKVSTKLDRKKGMFKVYNWHDSYGYKKKIPTFYSNNEAEVRAKAYLFYRNSCSEEKGIRHKLAPCPKGREGCLVLHNPPS